MLHQTGLKSILLVFFKIFWHISLFLFVTTSKALLNSVIKVVAAVMNCFIVQ